MLNVLKSLQLKKTSGRFYAPLSGTVLQHIDANWYDAGDPNALRADDLSGNGNYALQDKDFSVVPAGIADRAIGNFEGNDTLLTGVCGNGDIQHSDFNISFDFYIPSTLSGEVFVFLAPEGVGSNQGLRIDVRSINRIDCLIKNQDLSTVTIVNDSFKLDVWNHYEVSRVGDTLTVSLNGNPDVRDITGWNPQESTTNRLELSWDLSESIYIKNIVVSDCVNHPLDDGVGTTIRNTLDTENTGTLTDSGGTFWANGIAKKITLNNTALTGPAGYPADGVELTKVQIEALHNGETMFATPAEGAGNFRFIAYPDGTVLTDDQKATINAYTRNI